MEKEMTQQDVQNTANVGLTALSDSRVMVPANCLDGVADLKQILRQILTGDLVVMPAPPQAVPEPSKAGGKK